MYISFKRSLSRAATGLLVLGLASVASAYDCNGINAYSNGASYTNGATVTNHGSAYRCLVGGWCSIGGAYEPGVGWAAANAWSNLGQCNGSGGGNNNGGGSNNGGDTGSGGGSGSCSPWVAGQWYNEGDVVTYNGATYVAEHENPGYDPVISTWFWEPTSQNCGGGNDGGNNGGGNCAAWVAGQWYNEGDIVTYNGTRYVAEHENPGYDPVISTWFWEPTQQSCDGNGGGDNGGNDGGNNNTGFHISEQQFNQLFPNRNPFYTYQGFVDATKSFPAFAKTGSIETQKRELAAALANFKHETGDFVHITEIAKGEYCGNWGGADCGCRPGKKYYGRGPIQLSWNGNYCAAGKALGLDLVGNPDIVEQNSTVAWETAIWFWMTQSGAGNDTPHNAMVNGRGFGETIRSINGALECNGGYPNKVQSRINNYLAITRLLGVSAGSNLGC
ncbi:glycoside hydrolase family 19 protein [Reinekea blandensis]|uniref:Chitinase n=1 Tax=Reinekea blandensis MED297 TaxID=314283 RepID=A4BFB3_9GAMM|nr:glycoside hydrolase family 19 protein [Reinekea blandensis]EAR09226.1 chitinase [Reinekea sp. MED297] [Reinekea blandensis MED297]